jgi:GrpB-like predicted nucleotidyltransferase (UPF0157 family)
VDFIYKTMERRRDIKHLRRPLRHLAFESSISSEMSFLFFGFEVEKMDAVPEGMISWTLEPESLRVHAAREDNASESAHLPLEWEWRDTLHAHGDSWLVGEFALMNTLPFKNGFIPRKSLFWLSFNSFGEDEIEGGDKIELIDYQATWPEEFRRFTSLLSDRFGGDIILKTEHIGSTSIPGIPAKPVIDILALVPSFQKARERIIPLLNDDSWEYCWRKNHMLLIKRAGYKKKRTHHVHVVTQGHEQWNCVVFRDYLRSHPREAQAYVNLKKYLANKYSDDRERYTWGKAEFIGDILKRATDKNSH